MRTYNYITDWLYAKNDAFLLNTVIRKESGMIRIIAMLELLFESLRRHLSIESISILAVIIDHEILSDPITWALLNWP